MNELFMIEVPVEEMRKKWSRNPTAGFWFCNTDNLQDIKQFINEKFSTFNQEYEFFIHTIDLERIRKNHFTSFPVYYGYENDFINPRNITFKAKA